MSLHTESPLDSISCVNIPRIVWHVIKLSTVLQLVQGPLTTVLSTSDGLNYSLNPALQITHGASATMF